MSLIDIIGIAVGLSMDAFSVSVAHGCMMKKLEFGKVFPLVFSFGFFQALMPVAGWGLGITVSRFISSIAPCVGFGLLSGIGAKMIFDSFKKDKECTDDDMGISLVRIILLALATSIDAFAIGISMSLFLKNILIPVIMIGIITFFLCLGGVCIGNRFRHLFKQGFEVAGGIILIIIGIKILSEYLYVLLLSAG